ncbi:MAG: radical SAM protein [Verrucomicrobia bacterium]|nr:radical SAM protein [Verrucomicrobiota bacterium]
MKSSLHERAADAGVRKDSSATKRAEEAVAASQPAPPCGPAFGCPRDFLDNRFVYAVISPRARGLSVGVNMNPDQRCNFDCVYCEVNRSEPAKELWLNVPVMMTELERTLALIHSGGLRELARYQKVPRELLELRHVTLSGDGEPTLCQNFVEAVEAVVHLRARRRFPFFKLVLITNASGLDRPEVAEALQLLTPRDEVWAKLDSGTQEYMDRVNKPDCRLERIQTNITSLARARPVVIQSLFPSINGEGPSEFEIEAYVQRLRRMREAGAQIPLVQIYSATRPTPHSDCGHLPLRTLSAIAQRVREESGLKAEVF